MSSKTEQAALDANLMSNLICNEVFGEFNYGEELGTTLTASASKNLLAIDAMQNFSINLLKQIEMNDFSVEPKKAKVVSVEDKINEIQKEIVFDISKPIHDMFEEISGFVCEELVG